jgi:DNA-binding MarR family transcriptional regulator
MEISPVSRIRRFNRAVTTELGALEDSFLGRGRPLGAARVLNAIGHGFTRIADLRDYLGLDSGLTSRLLRGLEAEGLVETHTNPGDARARILRLTDKGEAEFASYEKLSDAQAEHILTRHPDQTALLEAMDLIANTFNRERMTIEQGDPRSAQSVYCLGEYYAELERRFERGFDVSLSRDPDAGDMIAPRGAFLLALSDGQPLGCVGLKGQGGPVAEIKRLWVSPSARGLGLARRLMQAAEETARRLSISTLQLDTNSALPEAEKLYRSSGWVEIPRFNDDPYPDLFFEKRL